MKKIKELSWTVLQWFLVGLSLSLGSIIAIYLFNLIMSLF